MRGTPHRGGEKIGGEKEKMSKVNVYENGKIIARVAYNHNLDHWDGHNWTSGGVGLHLGLTQLKDGRFALIHGTQWQGQRDWAEIISKERAIQEILTSGDEELLDKYGLRKEAEKQLIEEAE